MFNLFESPKNPNRKKGEGYKVSEFSQSAGDDFARNNILASRLYKTLKPIQPFACTRSTYTRLQVALYKAVRNDQIHDLGSLKLGYGDVSPLRGFRFSLKTSLGRFFVNKPVAYYNEDENKVEIRSSLKSILKFESIHERLAKLVIKKYCILIQLDEPNAITVMSSKDLDLKQGHSLEDRSVFFPLKDNINVLVLCLSTVRCWLKTPDEAEQFLSNDTTLMTAEVIDVILIRDGKCMFFPEKEANKMLPPIQPSDDELDWE
ncbi:hypothetical protein [Sphingobacterium siyangense]|uniref:Uncharacterized protein n=1 Tax=Sphingobacterium siyangense TaxID=459529 RepID=A0A562M7N9_9SPHI|nr:hypothetical protein [Sphingobacterium siyangense]TWI15945.1 hypothetical protein IQ31_04746 [Sphingobacterium siyangense]